MGTGDLWARALPSLLDGLWVTIQVSSIGVAASLVLGLMLAVVRVARLPGLRHLAVGYSGVVRGTPELLQLFLIYFGLAQLGLSLPAFLAGCIWLSLYGAAYASEVLRAGIMSVPRGQLEAGRALGLGRMSLARRVILPQAVATTLPPLTNLAILLVKASSLAYTISVAELMYQGNLVAMSTNRTVEVYVLVAALYLGISLLLARVAGRLEQRAEQYR